MRLTEELSENTDASVVEVFWEFVATLMSLLKQVDMSYHDDNFLRDRLITAVNMPSIQAAFQNPILRTGQQPAHRIVNRIPKFRKTACSSLVHYYSSREVPLSNQALYTLEQSYGGVARLCVKL